MRRRVRRRPRWFAEQVCAATPNAKRPHWRRGFSSEEKPHGSTENLDAEASPSVPLRNLLYLLCVLLKHDARGPW